MRDSESQEIKPSVESVPQELRELDQWICWRHERGKKPPFDPKTGAKAYVGNPETWTDFQTAYSSYLQGNYDGVGFVLTESDPFAGIDFDDCCNSWTGELIPEIGQEVDRLDSYTERSPSGGGVHVLIKGEKPTEFGCQDGRHVEVYDTARYFTFTGNHLEGTPKTIEYRQEPFQIFCETHLSKQPQKNSEQPIGLVDIGNSDSELIERGEAALHQLQEESPSTFSAVMDFLQGGISDFDGTNLTKHGGLIDRSSQEQVGISLCYSVYKRYIPEDEPQIRKITLATWNHYCKERPQTTDGQQRRWPTERRDYRQRISGYAFRTADPEKFDLMVKKKGGDFWRRCTHEYSELTYQSLWTALNELIPSRVEAVVSATITPHLSNGMYPADSPSLDGAYNIVHEHYPSKKEVIDRAGELDGWHNSRRTYEEAFRRMQSKFGDVAVARIGNTWVYYPADYPDPPEASYVVCEGEQRDPEIIEPRTNPAPSEDALRADGGTCVRDSTRLAESASCRSGANGDPSESRKPPPDPESGSL